jgi:hypothetical protein
MEQRAMARMGTETVLMGFIRMLLLWF